MNGVWLAFVAAGTALLFLPESAEADEPAFLNPSFSIYVDDYFEVFAMHPDDDRDLDEDMLEDDFENRLAKSFAPVALFDSKENTVRIGDGEPHVIYQVTPINPGENSVFNDGYLVRVTYQFLFADDGGWGDCEPLWSLEHKADNARMSIFVYIGFDEATLLYAFGGGQHLCNVRNPTSSDLSCREGASKTYFVDSRPDEGWSGWGEAPWSEPGRAGAKIPLFFSEDKHHIYFKRWGSCEVSYFWEGVSKDDRANGEGEVVIPNWSEMFNVGEVHTKDYDFAGELDVIAGDAYFDELYDTDGWKYESDWSDEHLWNLDRFLNSDDDAVSSLGEHWLKESPRHTGSFWNCFNWDGDTILDRAPRQWEEWLAEWEYSDWDKCPMGEYGTEEEETTDSDGDGWGNACDRCPDLFSFDQKDPDGDGANYGTDNCECEYNPLQEDCDGDGVGDACDPDKCIDFADNRIDSVVCSEGSWSYHCYSPTRTPIKYRTVGDDQSGPDYHDAQLRWCDCRNPNYNPLDPFTGGPQYSDEDCEESNCDEDNPLAEYFVQFDHERWHMPSLHGSGWPPSPTFTIWPSGEPGHAPRVDCDGAPSGTQWTQMGRDADVTDLWTYHCGPRSVDYSLVGSEAEHKTTWDWPWEIWWRDVEADDTAPFLSSSGSGLPVVGFADGPLAKFHYWIRPEWDPGAGLPIEGQLNKYESAVLVNPSTSFKFIKDTIFGRIPYVDMGDPHPFDLVAGRIDETEVASMLPQLARGTRVVLAAISRTPSAGSVFEYPARLAGEDAAIGGIVHILADRSSLEMGAMAYGTSEQAGGVPNTVDFSVADFALHEAAMVQSTSSQTGTSLWGRKLAVFGGRLASGALSDRLWIGGLAGLDDDGTPFFAWRDATPTNGEIPGPRAGATLFFDRYSGQLVLMGGESERGEIETDAWVFDVLEETWTRLGSPRGLPPLSGAEAIPFGNRVYIAGGDTTDGNRSMEIYELDIQTERARVVGDLTDGPGQRSGVSFAMSAAQSPKLYAFGGTDTRGAAHTDLWQLEVLTGKWSLLVQDCTGARCPSVSDLDVLMVDDSGDRFALYAGDDPENRTYFKTERNVDGWIPSDEIHPAPLLMGCGDSDQWDPEATKACAETGDWYAPVGVLGCPHPETGERSCRAPEHEPMSPLDEWSPDGWEWVIDFELAYEALYVLTDRALYAFNPSLDTGDLEPVEEIPLEMPGPWGWGSLPDPGFALERDRDRLYVGSWSGLHVFDVTDPLHPVETGRMSTWAPVADVKALGDVAYVADGVGVTAVDVSDPTAPEELGYTELGGMVLRLGIDPDEWSLFALASGDLIKMSLSDLASPEETDRVDLSCGLSWDMRTEGRWIYLNGLPTKTVWDGPDGLEERRPHDVRAWVAERAIDGERAYRLRPLVNSIEVWSVN